ncbi:hypothetical protein OPQ81_001889 [Rhizoctonia solani]|nr:hypothetical protein OPQ81_001889 [Rhizoctonia solani]
MLVAILSFLVIHFRNAAGAKYNKDAQEYSTKGCTSDTNLAPNVHGPVIIQNYYIPPDFKDRPSHPEGQQGFVVWGGCFIYSVLWTIFIIWIFLGYSKRWLSTEPEDGPTRHRVGRTPTIAISYELSPADSKANLSPTSTPEIVNTTSIGRGKQFPSQDSNSSRPPTPTTLKLWDVKEPYLPSSRRQIQMTSFVIGGLEQNVNSGDQEHGPISYPGSPIHSYPVQASLPRAYFKNRGVSGNDSTSKRAKVKTHHTPYLHLISPNQRPNQCRHRDSMPNMVETRLVHKRSSLEVSLYGNPRLVRPGFVAWFILVVAVNGRFPDPEHDLEFWKNMLNDPALESESIYFASLAGDEATRENIDKAITRLFHHSEALGIFDHSKLFVYLTGEGDGQNAMCLPKEEILSKKDINQLLWELRATWGYTRPITLVIDICRSDRYEQGIEFHHGIELISSCSAGQEAQAIRFQSDQDLPYSCFFLAMMIASFDSLASTSAYFKANVGLHLNELIDLMKSNPSKKASDENDKGPGPQKPDWSQVNDLSTLLELTRMLSRTKVARGVRDFFMRYFPVGNTTHAFITEYRPLSEGQTSHRLRGASMHAPVVHS